MSGHNGQFRQNSHNGRSCMGWYGHKYGQYWCVKKRKIVDHLKLKMNGHWVTMVIPHIYIYMQLKRLSNSFFRTTLQMSITFTNKQINFRWQITNKWMEDRMILCCVRLFWQNVYMNIYHLDYINKSCQHFGVKHLYHKEENKTNLVWKPGYSLYPLVYVVISLSSSVSSSHSSSSYPSRPSYSHFSYIMGRWVTGQNQYLTQALLKLKL